QLKWDAASKFNCFGRSLKGSDFTSFGADPNRSYHLGLVVLGMLVVVLMVRARRNASAKALSAEERARLDALINRERSS
ncbi:MAG: hypothetical protein VXV78_00750, partial [Pseudomonadota bacterium]|nr:hypothetical protein [Pseudomonadota bacterium]